jgi:DNA-binding LacI/PurR family transcriptional regulator
MEPPAPSDPTDPAPSFATIARVAGVSKMTVSRVLRHAEGASPATREKVLEAARELGYRHNPMVAALMENLRRARGVGESAGIAFLINAASDVEHPYNAAVLAGAEAQASALGYALSRVALSEYEGNHQRLSTVLWNRGLRGCVVGPQRVGLRLGLDFEQVPTVAIGYSVAEPHTLPRVTADYHNNLRQGLERLRAMGYRRIGYISHSQHEQRSDYRWRAAFESLARGDAGAGGQAPVLELTAADAAAERVAAFVGNNALEAVLCARPIAERYEKLFAPHATCALACVNLLPGDTHWAGVVIDQREVGAGAVLSLHRQLLGNIRGLPAYAQAHIIEGAWRDGPSCPQPRSTREGPRSRSTRPSPR